MKKLRRNMSDPESIAFWEAVERSAATVRDVPAWIKEGVILGADRHRVEHEPEEPEHADTSSLAWQ